MEIPPLTEAQKRLVKRYGNHTRTCAKQAWLDKGKSMDVKAGRNLKQSWSVPEPPECDCGWLEVLEAACKRPRS